MLLKASRNDFVLEGPSGMKCMIEIRPVVLPLLQWLAMRLCSSDKLILAKTRAIDSTDSETPAANRMLMSFHDKATTFGIHSIPRPLKGEPIQSLCKVFASQKKTYISF